jgi:hypothetical protein
MIVFKFGVRKILSGYDAARGEMRGAHHLYNALVSIERWKRAEYASISLAARARSIGDRNGL